MQCRLIVSCGRRSVLGARLPTAKQALVGWQRLLGGIPAPPALVGRVLLQRRIEATKVEPPLGHVELHRSDVTALSFVRGQQEWLTARPARPEQLRRSYRRINRTIQHLSWQRLSSSWDQDHNPFAKSQDWSVWDVWDALKPTIQTFLDHVEDAVLSEGFRYYAQRALRDDAIV